MEALRTIRLGVDDPLQPAIHRPGNPEVQVKSQPIIKQTGGQQRSRPTQSN
jgi:hypothetical protein